MILYRIFQLAFLQLGKKINHKKKNIPFILKNIFLALAGIAGVTVLFLGLFLILNNLIYFPITKDLFFFFVIVIEIINILSTTLYNVKYLYSSKDNQILLALPVKNEEVYLSKLLVTFLSELKKNIFVLFPLFIAYGLYNKCGFLFYLISIISNLILPLISSLIASLISIPILYLGKVLKKVKVISIFIFIGFLIGIYFGINYLLSIVPHLIRLKAMYVQVLRAIDNLSHLIVNYSLYFIWFRDFVIDYNFVSFLYIICLIIGLILFNWLISKPLYFNLASASMEVSNTKKHRKKVYKNKKVFWTFVQKEVTLTMRDLPTLIRNYGYLIMMPFILYLLNGFIFKLSLNSVGVVTTLTVNVLIGLLLISASHEATSSAISKEGSEFAILKTSPSEVKKICWAKMFVSLIITTLLIIVGMIVLLSFKIINPVLIFQISLIFIFTNIGMSQKCIEIDIDSPSLKDYATGLSTYNNKNAQKAITFCFIISLIMSVITFILYFKNINDAKMFLNTSFDLENIVNTFSQTKNQLLIILGILSGFIGLKTYFLYLNIDLVFERIEI